MTEGQHPNSINDDAVSEGAGREAVGGATSKTRPTPATDAYALPYPYYEEDEIDLLDLILVLAKHKRLILLFTLGLAFVTGVISLVMTPIYKAETCLVPPQTASSTSAMSALAIGALSQLDMPDFIMGGLGAKTPSDLIVGIAKSRTVLDNIIDRFNLMAYYEAEYRARARERLSDATDADVDSKTGLITIAVQDKDPALAAEMANAFVEELQRIMQNLAITQAAQQRLFLENQLKDVRLALARSEEELKEYQARSGLLNVDAQTEALMDSIADLRALVAAKEVELQAAKTFATGRNPEVQRLQAELKGLRGELQKLEAKAGQAGQSDSAIVPFRELPEAGMEYLRKLRDFKFNETLYEMLLKQYEAARLTEAQEAMVVQVVDPAVPPELKYKPKRKLMVAIAGVLGLFLSIFLAFFLEFLHNASNDPERAAKMAQLKTHLRFRKSSAKPT
ncbi:MAG TPA: GNVR domain-containing protein [Thermosynergistes sp.]|nr:GNVR domain-containing protein [Thermosynergistes sp.]